jgi:hypothetical protein
MPPDESTSSFPWDIRRQGRAGTRDEWEARRDSTPEKIELIGGKLFWTDEDRLAMLALLLETVGVDQVVRLGNPEIWREAIAALDRDME